MPGPGRLGESALTIGQLPELEGFTEAIDVDVAWGEERRLAARYDFSDGAIVIVSHETGPQIFFAVLSGAAGAAGTAAAGAAIRGATTLVKWVLDRRGGRGSDAVPLRFWFVEDGRVKAQEVFAEREDSAAS